MKNKRIGAVSAGIIDALLGPTPRGDEHLDQQVDETGAEVGFAAYFNGSNFVFHNPSESIGGTSDE